MVLPLRGAFGSSEVCAGSELPSVAVDDEHPAKAMPTKRDPAPMERDKSNVKAFMAAA
jgi:hypothetical protein